MKPLTIREAIAARFDHLPAWVAIIQLFIGMGWLRAGVEKLISADWWNGTELLTFLNEHDGIGLPLYEQFVDVVVAPNAVGVSLGVMVVQFAIAAALLSGRFLVPALAVGMFLNLNFVAAGAVDPSVFYLLSQGAVLLWLAERARYRVADRALQAASLGGLMLAAVSLPSVRTVMPDEVIYDPSVILVTVGALTAVGAELCQRRRSAPRSHQQRLIEVG